ncbi:MAG: metallophosphoesterase [Anaerolineae bacterium]|nr:metallophosphoesterase [Anaerolineae bacterium]
MVAAKATNEEVLEAYKEHRTVAAAARALGLSTRRVHTRLREMGVPAIGSNHFTKPKAVYEAHGRVHFGCDNGKIIVFSDAHFFPGYVTTAHRALLKLCRELKPRSVVCNGDAFDGSTISRWPRIGWDRKPTVIEELKTVKERLDEIEDAASTKNLYWPLGNHDSRFTTFLAAAAPQYEGVPGFELKDHFPLWKPCWSLWVNDDAVIKHRWKGGIHATRNNTLNSGKTIITGHLHSLKVTPFTDYRGTRWGVDTGTLADPYGPQFVDYTEDNPVDWRSGFIVLTFHDGELLRPQEVQVVREGLVEYRGDRFNV